MHATTMPVLMPVFMPVHMTSVPMFPYCAEHASHPHPPTSTRIHTHPHASTRIQPASNPHPTRIQHASTRIHTSTHAFTHANKRKHTQTHANTRIHTHPHPLASTRLPPRPGSCRQEGHGHHLPDAGGGSVRPGPGQGPGGLQGAVPGGPQEGAGLGRAGEGWGGCVRICEDL